MTRTSLFTRLLWVASVLCLRCTQAVPPEGVWRPRPGEETDRIPGPIKIKGFGSFESFPKALDASCSLVLSMPNAAVGHIQDAAIALRTATEYCAWLYYTPEQRYELSMLTDLQAPGDHLQGNASCLLPWHVDDPRYAPENIKHLFYIHNHALAGELSDRDIRLAVEMASIHGWVAGTVHGQIPVAVIVFISSSGRSENPACDGAYQYIPATNELLKWTKTAGVWHRGKIGTVIWHGSDRFTIQRE